MLNNISFIYLLRQVSSEFCRKPQSRYLHCVKSVQIRSISFFFFFSIWVSFHEYSPITGLQGKVEGISLTPHYHLHPLHRHLDISRAITAESSPLSAHRQQPDSNWDPLVSERKSLTTKLRVLNGVISGPYFPVFSPNTGKYEPEITTYLDTFHAVLAFLNAPP